MLFVYLCQKLPMYLPKITVTFSGALHQTVQRQVKLIYLPFIFQLCVYMCIYVCVCVCVCVCVRVRARARARARACVCVCIYIFQVLYVHTPHSCGFSPGYLFVSCETGFVCSFKLAYTTVIHFFLVCFSMSSPLLLATT